MIEAKVDFTPGLIFIAKNKSFQLEGRSLVDHGEVRRSEGGSGMDF